MFYVYVLRSKHDGMLYTVFSTDLKKRFIDHNEGRVKSTKTRGPFELLYYEACRQLPDALRREKYLKTTYGHRYLKSRLRTDFDG